MSVPPRQLAPVPEETARIARAVFPKGNLYMRIRDELTSTLEDPTFMHVFGAHTQLAQAPWRLVFVTLFQFAEHFSDRQATDAIRARIDWKYALSLPLTDMGVRHTTLSEFRDGLLTDGAEYLLLDVLLDQCQQRGLIKMRGRQRTNAADVLAALRMLNYREPSRV